MQNYFIEYIVVMCKKYHHGTFAIFLLKKKEKYFLYCNVYIKNHPIIYIYVREYANVYIHNRKNNLLNADISHINSEL